MNGCPIPSLTSCPIPRPPPKLRHLGVASPESTTTQQLDLNQTEDAKRVQQRLIERGFLFGAADGVWGSRSRKALQDFRIANGMGDGDTWDEATQERLLTTSDAYAANISNINFIGRWGVDAAQCREAPLKIAARRAEAPGAACDFRSTQREGLNVWRMRAQCASNGERWTANIRFTLSGSKLVWSSERGTTSYVRCPS
jgi:peptidoglycan hydrolase-like protein with peptidoglycan-binding domain